MDFVGPSDLEWLAQHGVPFAADAVAAHLGCPQRRPDLCVTSVEVAASPQTYVHAGVPPAYFAYGAYDLVVPVASQGLSIERPWAAERDGNGVEFEVARAGHNLDMSNFDDRTMERWLDRLLAGDFAPG